MFLLGDKGNELLMFLSMKKLLLLFQILFFLCLFSILQANFYAIFIGLFLCSDNLLRFYIHCAIFYWLSDGLYRNIDALFLGVELFFIFAFAFFKTRHPYFCDWLILEHDSLLFRLVYYFLAKFLPRDVVCLCGYLDCW